MSEVKPLSSIDITKYMNNDCTIMKYEELDKYNNLRDIFWNSRYVFLLYPITPLYGHWVLVSLHNNNVEIYDSFGLYPDTEDQHGTKKMPKYLSDLMIKSPSNIKLSYNDIQQQAWDTNYCGYHACCRAYHSNMKLDKYNSMLKNSGITPDEYVYNFVMNL
jgi:hypothetical protein